MAARETHKARARWYRWSATPTDIAAVARTAASLVGESGGPVEVAIHLEAPAWESEYIDPDAFVSDLLPGDLADVETIKIRAEAQAHRIAVTIERPMPASASLFGPADPRAASCPPSESSTTL